MRIIKSIQKSTQRMGSNGSRTDNRATITRKGYLGISPVALKEIGVPSKADVFITAHLMEDSKGTHVVIAIDPKNGFKMYRPTDGVAPVWVQNPKFQELPAGEYSVDPSPKKIGKATYYKLVESK